MRLLTRLIGITLYNLTAALALKHNIYIYVKVGCLGIAIPSEIRSKVTHLGGRGLVAIQATHGPLQQISTLA